VLDHVTYAVQHTQVHPLRGPAAAVHARRRAVRDGWQNASKLCLFALPLPTSPGLDCLTTRWDCAYGRAIALHAFSPSTALILHARRFRSHRSCDPRTGVALLAVLSGGHDLRADPNYMMPGWPHHRQPMPQVDLPSLRLGPREPRSKGRLHCKSGNSAGHPPAARVTRKFNAA